MKFEPVRLANAMAIVGAGLYVVCVLLVSTTPGFYMGMMGSWMHGVDVSRLPLRAGLPAGLGIYGLITFTVAAWLSGYALAWTYNQLGEKK